MCGFIAQLVEHRTGIAEDTDSNPVEALILSGFFFPIAQIEKLTTMFILHFLLADTYKLSRELSNLPLINCIPSCLRK